MPQEVIEITEREIEIIEVIERGPVGPTGPQPDINYEVVSSARTLEAADLIAADTSGGAFTLTLPSNPSNGDAVDIFDFSETFDTNPLTIARNGQPIESLNEDLVANVEGAYFTLIYTGATRGWQILPRYGTTGGGGESVLTTQGDMVYRGAAINERLPIGSAGQILKVNSGGNAPEWGAAPATGVTSVGVTGSDGIEVDSGSPVTGSGSIALGVNAATLRSHINVADGANNYTHPNHSGEVTSSGDGATTIANDVVTNAKLANVATATIKGRATEGTGDPEDLSASQVRTILNVADGAEVNVQSNWTEADSGSDAFILNKPASFTPTAHAASHASAGSDPLFDQNLNTTDDVAFNSVAVGEDGDFSLDGEGLKFGGELKFSPEENNFYVAGNVIFGADANFVNVEKPILFTGAAAATSAATTRTNLGLGNSATLDTGTSAGTVAEGNHTHADLHTRSHAITSTSDHTAGNHKVFYSDGSGNVQELALGDSGKVLQSNGATSAPTWETPSGGVSAIGTSAADILSVSGSDIVADDAGADRIVFWDDSESKLAYLEAGSGLSISGTTITATASGGSKTYAVFTPDNNQPPASNYATLDTRNSVACLDFDDATDESAVFVSIIPEGASLGSGLKIRLHWAATTATSGDCVWLAALERMNTDLDSDSFDTAGTVTTACNGTSGIVAVSEITLTNIDSVTAGDGFRLKITRDADSGSDTLSGDVELVLCEVRSAA